eukprot:TRINITY_DN13711_c0_g1_i1.p1 TRINITY_DN13711_c0_g1~~TRINITY_DN13711_c0_g1_i1.p1  ORF type:complete len:444 (-),score=102.25 TRINITY_DN13711_c0_g1_i1:97-1428(-)
MSPAHGRRVTLSRVLVASLATRTLAIRSTNSREVAAELASEKDGETSFNVFHYNILADSYAQNSMPWFLFGLPHTDKLMPQSRRDRVEAEYWSRPPHMGTINNAYNGVLSQSEVDLIQDYDRKYFQWKCREVQLLHEILPCLDDYPEVPEECPDVKQHFVKKKCPEIISLVEWDQYHNPVFQKRFKAAGYEGALAVRPRGKKDGAALYWKKERFQMVSKPIRMNYQDFNQTGLNFKEDRAMIATTLYDKVKKKKVVAVSTHLMRNPELAENDPKRMIQIHQMMNQVSCYSASNGAHALLVFGDLNSEPSSWTHVALQHGWPDCPGSEKGMEDLALSLHECTNDCQHVCSTKTQVREMWIDYIFASGKSLKSNGFHVARCPKTAIPNADHPSDHLPVGATLDWKDDFDGEPLDRCGGAMPKAQRWMSVDLGSEPWPELEDDLDA